MKKLILAVVVWLTAAAAFAQPIQPGQKATLGAANAVAIISTVNNTTLTVQVLGTWTGTLTFEGSLDGSTYTATNCTAINGTSAVTTTTSNGVWSCSVIGINALQTRFSSFGSGSAIVSYQTAYVAGGSGGGGSGGSVSITQGGNTAAVNGSSQLSVTCANCSGSGVSQIDNTGFTPGTTLFVPLGGEVDDVATTAVTENSAGSARITAQRGLHANLRNNAGTEIGVAATPLQVSLANTAANATAVKVDGSAVTQPISGTVTVTDGAGALNVIVDSGTVAATQSGTWTVQPGNTANTTAWKVDGSAVTQPVSAASLPLPTLASTSTKQSDGTQKTQIVDGSGNVIASTSNNLNVQCANCSGSGVSAADEAAFTEGTSLFAPSGGYYKSSITALTTGQQGAVALTPTRSFHVTQYDSSGNVVTPTVDATTNTTTQTTGPQVFYNGSTAAPSDVGADGRSVAAWSTLKGAQVTAPSFAGVVAVAGNGVSGTGVQRVTLASDSTGTVIATSATAANLLARTDTSGATGAAPPARADYVGGLQSGATGGFVGGIPVCDSFKAVSMTSATTTLMVTGVSGRHVRICSINLVTAIANNVVLISGTGATCGTGTGAIMGGTTAANGWNFAANGGIALGSGIGTVMQTAATGDSVCIITSAAGPLAGTIAYTIY